MTPNLNSLMQAATLLPKGELDFMAPKVNIGLDSKFEPALRVTPSDDYEELLTIKYLLTTLSIIEYYIQYSIPWSSSDNLMSKFNSTSNLKGPCYLKPITR